MQEILQYWSNILQYIEKHVMPYRCPLIMNHLSDMQRFLTFRKTNLNNIVRLNVRFSNIVHMYNTSLDLETVYAAIE
jgi:hypothetical protein